MKPSHPRTLALLAFVPFLGAWQNPGPNLLDVVGIPQRLKKFDEIMAVLNSGGVVRAVFNYNKCMLPADNGELEPGPEAIGGTAFSTWEYFAKGAIGNDQAYVSTSETKLIGRKKKDGTYVHLQNYVKVNVKDDGKVEVTAQYLIPTTFEVKMDETFSCEISTQTLDKGAAFYRVK